MSGELSVLKFGGSVLRGEADLPTAVAEAQRFRRESDGVVIVVSAFFGLTDQLLSRARGIADEPDPTALAVLAATGEQASVALVTVALREAGIPARAFDGTQLGIRTRGGILEAEPIDLVASRLTHALEAGEVVVAPGFVGRDAVTGESTLLGRGGSDLSAIFVAERLGARRCRLIKDVNGIFERDPALPGPPARRFSAVSWGDAIRLGGGIVQERCLRYARSRDLEFEVAAWGSHAATLVGRGPSRLEGAEEPAAFGVRDLAGALA